MLAPGAHIAALLAARGLSQGQLARATGLFVQEVSAIVLGHTGMTIRTALLISKALSTSEIELLDLQREIDLAKARKDMARRLAKVERLPLVKEAA